MHINLKDIKTNGYYGAGILAIMLTACFVLIYLLMHDPYKDLHNRIFEIDFAAKAIGQLPVI